SHDLTLAAVGEHGLKANELAAQVFFSGIFNLDHDSRMIAGGIESPSSSVNCRGERPLFQSRLLSWLVVLRLKGTANADGCQEKQRENCHLPATGMPESSRHRHGKSLPQGQYLAEPHGIYRAWMIVLILLPALLQSIILTR